MDNKIKEFDSCFTDRWVAYFDLLGFSRLVCGVKSDFNFRRVLIDYQEILEELSDSLSDKLTPLSMAWFSDSFLIYTEDGSPQACYGLQTAATSFMRRCLAMKVPVRGAISFGSFCADKENYVFIGEALVDAVKEAEKQDWIGLLLTKNAVNKIKSYGVNPERHSFADVQVPTKNMLQGCLAYTFIVGQKSQVGLLRFLEEMKKHAPEKDKIKYEHTIKHIKCFDALQGS